MSEIKELIERLCPDGVEYKKLVGLAEVGTGSSNKQDSSDDGKYPFFVRSKFVERHNNYEYDEEAIIIPGEGGIGDIFHFINGKYALHQRVYRIHFTTNSVNTKFAYYYLRNSFKKYILGKAVSATVTSIRKPMIQNFEIPVPPIEVQRKIVEILDNFTELEAELERKLEAELEARRKQYEYYRDNLFRTSTNIKKIGDLTKVFSCPRVFRNQWKESGIPFWRSSDVMSYHNGVKNPRGEVFISQSLYQELSRKTEKIEKGDLLVTGGGSIGMPYLKRDNNPLFVKDADLICIKKCDNFIPSFLYHYFFTTEFRTYLKKITHDATIAHYTINQIKDTPIPVPPIEEQKRIVAILDRFEALTTDLQSGLPAEIEARRKQYEYYREKLLTFKRKSA